jgi:hypothetical protein
VVAVVVRTFSRIAFNLDCTSLPFVIPNLVVVRRGGQVFSALSASSFSSFRIVLY